MTSRTGLLIVLVLIGAGWGLTMPLTKIAVTAGYRDFGLIFWQMMIGAVVLSAVTYLRGRRISVKPIHLGVYAFIAALGTIIPNVASYTAAVHLPAGIMAIVISMVPMLAFPVAISLGVDRFSARRALGLTLGLTAVALIALPEASLPDARMVAWLPLPLFAALCYAFEGNLVARFGTFGLDPVQVLAGASILGAIVIAPVAVLSGNFINPIRPWALPEVAIIGIGLFHAIAYTGYVWLVGQAGSVFAAQVSYIVTGFGVFWSWLILSETYSTWVWAALILMFAGIFLVQPRKPGLQPGGELSQDKAD